MIRDLLRRKVKAYCRDESATATMEFVIMFPLILIVFIAAFESSMILTRQIMLERTLDMSVRILRLAQGVVTDADEVRTSICDATRMLPNCHELLSIDLQIIDTDTYELPSDDQICANRGNDMVIAPDNSFVIGGQNEFLLIRTCLIVDRILPFSGFGLGITSDDSGGLHLMASTIFLNEP